MAVALTALFIALSGTAIALPGRNRVDKNDYRRSSIGTRAIANNSIRSRDIRNGTITGRDINEASLDTVTPPFVPAALENGWEWAGGASSRPGHWIDRDGVVHLQGTIKGGTPALVFRLPPDARPQRIPGFEILCGGGGRGLLSVYPNGAVSVVPIPLSARDTCKSLASLDGFEFRRDN